MVCARAACALCERVCVAGGVRLLLLQACVHLARPSLLRRQCSCSLTVTVSHDVSHEHVREDDLCKAVAQVAKERHSLAS